MMTKEFIVPQIPANMIAIARKYAPKKPHKFFIKRRDGMNEDY